LEKLRHALRRQAGRGIHDAEIRIAIVRGTLKRVRETAKDGVRYRWESSDRILRVAYYLRPCAISIKTVMYR